ncbi:MAG TPA: hypothetical protein VGF17_30910 [Phytomonospora sp.]
MSTERLQRILRDVADEARPVGLEEAALAQSRRMTVRRTALSGIAAVVLLAAGVVGAVTVWGGGKGVPEPAASQHSATVPSPSASVPSTPGEYDGAYYYLRSAGAKGELLKWVPGNSPEVVLSGDSTMLITANVSPDGSHLSWVDDRNKLMLRELANGDQRELMDYSPGDICREPTWSITSFKILAADADGKQGIYDITTDTFTPLGFEVGGCHARLAEHPGGQTAVETGLTFFDPENSTVVTLDDNGDTTGGITLDVPGRRVTDMISGGGESEYYCFQTTDAEGYPGDAARGNHCDTLAEPGDPASATYHPGAGNLFQFCDGMARKEVDGAMVLTWDPYDDELEAGEFLPEDPSLDEAWLLAFTSAE